MENINQNNIEDSGVNEPSSTAGMAHDLQNNAEFSDWKKKAALFISGQAVSLFGSSLVQYAIIWYITLTTHSGQMMTISSICSFLPQIVISMFAGVWADRYNRRVLIMLADALIAFSTLILALVFLSGYRELWLLFLVSGIRSMGTGIQTPAVNALIPQIVPQEKLTKVNGINGSIQSFIMLLSPTASGALLSMAPLETSFFIDVATALIAISIMLFFLKVPTHKRSISAENTSYLDELRAGIKYTWKNTFIRNLLIFYSVFYFLITPVAFLTPLMVTRSFGEEVWRLTLNEITFFGGSIIGGALFAVWGGFKNRIYTIALSSTAFGILTVALGLSSIFAVYLVVMCITGIFMPFFSSPGTVLLQERVAQDMQGRVFSLLQIIGSTVMPFGMLFFGPVADIIKVELLLITSGLLLTIVGVSIFYNKGLKDGVQDIV